MNKHNNDTVLSFPTVGRLEKITIKEVEKLVKRGELEKVVSKIFKVPAITRDSYEKYMKRKEKV